MQWVAFLQGTSLGQTSPRIIMAGCSPGVLGVKGWVERRGPSAIQMLIISVVQPKSQGSSCQTRSCAGGDPQELLCELAAGNIAGWAGQEKVGAWKDTWEVCCQSTEPGVDLWRDPRQYFKIFEYLLSLILLTCKCKLLGLWKHNEFLFVFVSFA